MNYKQTNTATIWLAVLSLLLLGSSLYYWNKTSNLTKEKYRTELRADSLFSVKLTLERDIQQISNDLNAQLTDAAVRNDKLEAQMESVQNRLQAKNKLLSSLRRQTIADNSRLQQQLTQLEDVRNNLQSELVQLKAQNQQVLADNTGLKHTMASLADKTNVLNTELMATKALVTVDNFRVDIRKPNSKLTAKARKAKQLQISFKLPSTWKTEGVEPIYVSITDLKNNPVDGALHTETIHVSNSALQIPVHAVKTVDFSTNPQTVTIDYEPMHTVAAGVYKVKLYTKNNYLGATEFGLRNSFWFF
ncbi:hypothetical protein WBJ53_15500 [Spirosoma sp. SC4-14]|uniref:hypothetical protein n=1 Tax=Spirosoma sp. SC4-14 TaxID=3128900 RepID=UPI0030CBD9BF